MEPDVIQDLKLMADDGYGTCKDALRLIETLTAAVEAARREGREEAAQVVLDFERADGTLWDYSSDGDTPDLIANAIRAMSDPPA